MNKLNPNKLEVGERIRQIRENLKMSRETFSEMIDISETFLGQIERGNRLISLKTLCKISNFTGFSCDYILFGDMTNNDIRTRINRILENSSDANLEYIYEIIKSSNTFFKTYYK